MAKIGAAGPSNAAVLDIDKGQIQKEDAQILVVDDDRAKKLRFIKEGEFDEKACTTHSLEAWTGRGSWEADEGSEVDIRSPKII